MIVGERRYDDDSGALLYSNFSLGTITFKKSDELKLEYKHLDVFSAKVGATTGMRLNRLNFGLTYLKGYHEYHKTSKDEKDSNGSYKRLISFQALSDEMEVWLSYTFVINSDWSSHVIYLSYIPVNKIKFKNLPDSEVVNFEQKFYILGYSYSFLSSSVGVATYFEDVDIKNYRFGKSGYGLKFSTWRYPLRLFASFDLMNFEDKLITEEFKIGMSVYF